MQKERRAPYLFISERPEEAGDVALRKSIRSWVTTAQHKSYRERSQQLKQEPASQYQHQNAATSESIPRGGLDAQCGVSPTRRKLTSVLATPPPIWTATFVGSSAEEPQPAQRGTQARVPRRQHRHLQELRLQDVPAFVHGTMVTSDIGDAVVASSMLIQSPKLEDPTDVLRSYARLLGTSGSSIWARYLWQEREHGRLFHAQHPQYKGWGPKYLHPLILSNQAVLATTVLFTGCHLRYQTGESLASPAILRLRSLSHNFVQAAIDSESEQLSDSTILAVIKLALFEAFFGTQAAYHIHMEGITQIVHLRGGLSNLGMDGYIAHLLVWFDTHLSATMKTPRYLEEGVSLSKLETVPVIDEELFKLNVEPQTQLGCDAYKCVMLTDENHPAVDFGNFMHRTA